MRWIAFALLIGLLGAAGSCQPAAPEAELYIVSPQGINIRREFATAFSQWHQKKYGTPVRIHWPDLGGTSNIVRFLQSYYETNDTCGYDLMFGGGSAAFDKMQAAKRRDGTPFPWIVPARLPSELLQAVPRETRGAILRGPDDAWVAATMSYFGIVLSKTRLRELGLPVPRTWAALAGPEWFGHLCLADPSKSGSVMTSYEMLLQQYGWEKGWPILVQMFANTQNIKDVGSAPAEEVGTENAAAGVVIDFFGRIQIAKQGPDLVDFVVPEGGSALDADPVAVLRGAPHRPLADHFVEFVISPPGQLLWVLKPGTPGGPVRSALGRMAILEDLYTTRAADMTDPKNPFAGVPPPQVDRVAQGRRSVFLGELVKAALIDNHAALRAARQAVHSAGDPPELLARFNTLPLPTADLKKVAEDFRHSEQVQTEYRRQWRQDAAALFGDILRAAPAREKSGVRSP